MYFDSNIEYEDAIMNEMIEKEMYAQKRRSTYSISKLGSHFLGEQAIVLANDWFDSLFTAEKIAESLNLGKLDFLAILEDFDGFKEEYLRDRELYQDF